jgi:hypothetical protein
MLRLLLKEFALISAIAFVLTMFYTSATLLTNTSDSTIVRQMAYTQIAVTTLAALIIFYPLGYQFLRGFPN